jgi:voltage-gated sodium channel
MTKAVSGVSKAVPKGLRAKLKQLVEHPIFTRTIIALIIINAILLGLETYPAVMSAIGPYLKLADKIILWIFVVELVLRLFAYGWRFFKDPWNIFDTIIVLVAFVPANEAMAVLRAARILRVLRLISIFPRLRRVIEGLIAAIPGIGSIGAILVIVFYVFAVMATKLFAADHPLWFGSLQASMFSLFQIMTLEGWADMVREVSVGKPWATPFFIVYILVATFTVLNLFIAVIVDAMQRVNEDQESDEMLILKDIQSELKALREKVDNR